MNGKGWRNSGDWEVGRILYDWKVGVVIMMTGERVFLFL